MVVRSALVESQAIEEDRVRHPVVVGVVPGLVGRRDDGGVVGGESVFWIITCRSTDNGMMVMPWRQRSVKERWDCVSCACCLCFEGLFPSPRDPI